MKLAIIERITDRPESTPFNLRYYLDNYYKEIFDELDILLIPVISINHLDEICNICDVLILTGSSNNIYPKYYNELPIKNVKYKFDEFPLVKKAVDLFSKNKKPILGICAGIQEINVIFGGTLYQKIPNHDLEDQSMHKIKINQDSFLEKVYNKNFINVNSYHIQAIKDLAPGFKISAISEDGIIEAIEKDNIIGVQWHPEVLMDMEFFKSFIKLFFN